MDDCSTYSESVHHHYDWATTEPSMAIIGAIASLEEVTPADLSTTLDNTLYDYVDPEALDALVTADSRLVISFSIADYGVRITEDGLTIRYD
ncbi:HalOD1 output domain-containing protein [Natrinema longum]|uniref:Halobacterial output domain-containing protein n=1 Tax=Natrinema longum TaxID=370324 RepID=A0A8A2UB80_9EURY|nr:HalOD1 output domain-containing protein [Natrinema longum]MBZ6496189.1 hypothetical protein [Natrinema longum]QSW85887.1 hypothetical protein J0X27_03365 [Natrinema longum]